MRRIVKSKNCPNCAAPYDVALSKCPYCGTSYFDMSCIDITGDEPFYLKLKMNGCIFTSRVLARPETDISVTSEKVCIHDWSGGSSLTANVNRGMDIDLHFISVPSSRELFRIELEENE